MVEPAKNSIGPLPKKPHNQTIGKWGEQHAARFMSDLGYAILERNFRTPYGEIDLICSKDAEVVMVEVKTRSNTKMGYPEEAITRRKWSHLVQAAEEYMADRPDLPQNWRVDLISIIGSPRTGLADISHFENVIHD